jgi:hypothetical protein
MAASNIYDRFLAQLTKFLVQARIATPASLRGCSLADIRAVEASSAKPWPPALIAALATLGGGSGKLFDGDDFGLRGFKSAAEVAAEIAANPWRLEPLMLPILQHDGYCFHFIGLDQGDDPPVDCYVETEKAPSQASPTFTAWLRELALLRLEIKPWNDEICRAIVAAREAGQDWLQRKSELDRHETQARDVRTALKQRVAREDQQRGAITGPLEFQARWVKEIEATELCRTLRREGKRIPWGWQTLDEL